MLEGSRPYSGSLPDKNQLVALLIPCLACCYLVITSTVSLFPEIPIYDTKRIAEFILLSIVFLATLANSSLRNAFAKQLSRLPIPIRLGIALFFLLGVASSFANADSIRGLVYSLVDVSLLGLLFVLALSIAACRSIAGTYFDRFVISAIVILGLAVGVQELTGFWAAWSIGLSYNFDIALAYFSFPRMYNQLQTWTIPVLAALPFLFSRNRLAAAICIITLGLHWYILIVSGARGSIISLLAAFTIATLLSPIARKAIIKWQFAGILLGILLYAGLYAVTESGKGRVLVDAQSTTISERHATDGSPHLVESNKFYDRSVGRPMLHTTGRSGLWKTATKTAYQHPLLGIGPMNFACKGPAGRVGSPHNLAFQILSEWGIPATIVLATLSLWLLWFLFNGLNHQVDDINARNVLRVLLITGVLAALVHLLVSSLLIAPASQVAAALIGGWLLGILPQHDINTKTNSAVVLLSSAAFCSLLLLPFAQHETARMSSYRQQLPAGEEGKPRLWQLGKACSESVQNEVKN